MRKGIREDGRMGRGRSVDVEKDGQTESESKDERECGKEGGGGEH